MTYIGSNQFYYFIRSVMGSVTENMNHYKTRIYFTPGDRTTVKFE